MRQYDAKRQNHPQIIKTARSVFRLGQALGERLIKDLHPISPMVTFCKRDHSPFWVAVQRISTDNSRFADVWRDFDPLRTSVATRFARERPPPTLKAIASLPCGAGACPFCPHQDVPLSSWTALRTQSCSCCRRRRPQPGDQNVKISPKLHRHGNFGHLERHVTAMADHRGTEVDQHPLEAGQRPNGATDTVVMPVLRRHGSLPWGLPGPHENCRYSGNAGQTRNAARSHPALSILTG